MVAFSTWAACLKVCASWSAGHWAICTWTDADIGAQLVRELSFKDRAWAEQTAHPPELNAVGPG